jgi:hypothetical protein
LTAPARVGFCDAAGRDEETGFQIEQRNTRSRKQESKKARKQESKKARKQIAALKPLDNENPIQGTSGSNREAESTDAPVRGALPRSSDEAG